MEDLKAGLEERGYSNVSITTQQTEKLNESYESISITPEGSNVGVNTNLENFFKAVAEVGQDYDAVVARAVDLAANGIEQAPSFDVKALTDYEQMKDKLIMEVVGTEGNAELLSKVPHVEMEDLSVVYRFVMESNGDERASVLVNNNMLNIMGVTPEQLHADAMENAPQLKPAVITGMNEIMVEMMGREQAEMMGIPLDAEEQMFVATVPDKIHGAGVLAYQDFMDQAAERVGGECLGISWNDLDFEKSIIRVVKTLTYRPEPNNGCVVHISTPKTEAGERTIPMIDEVYDAFLEEYQIQKVLGFGNNEIDGYKDFVFSTAEGNVYTPESVNRAIKRIYEDYNAKEKTAAEKEDREPLLLPHFSAHNLRHTFCTRLCENESNLKVIQSVMGHSDIQTTMDIYAECTQEKKQEVFATLNGKIMIK